MSGPFGNPNGASSASFLFGSTPSDSLFATQSSTPFGTAVAPCFGSTPSNPFRATQSSTPFGITVGNSNGAFGAPCIGSTPSNPLPATLSSNLFGTAVGNSNGASGASFFGWTPSKPLSGTQSSNLFGTAVGNSNSASGGTNIDPFGQSSSNFTAGFGKVVGAAMVDNSRGGTSRGPFGQPSSSFTGLRGVTLFCLIALFATAAFTTPTLQPSSTFPLGGGGAAIVDKSCEGTRWAPYQQTPAEEDVSSFHGSYGGRFTSISAMNCYCNKSHEELRLEDYKQIRNGASSMTPTLQPSSAFPFGGGGLAIVDNSCGGTRRAPYRQTPAEEDVSSFHGGSYGGRFTSISAMNCYCNKSHEELRSEDYKQIRNGDSSSSCSSDKNRTTPAHTSPVQTSVAQTPAPAPAATPTTTTTISNQTSNEIKYGIEDHISFIQAFKNGKLTFEASGSNGEPLNSELGTPVLGFPILIPTTLAFIPQQPQVSDPTSAGPLLQTETLSSPRNSAFANLSTFAVTSHVSPSAAPTNAAPSVSASPAPQRSSSIPKALEIIVEHLGFNPWEGKNDLLQDSQAGHIILCEDASDDPDILSLAEFAVEQHNAMEQFSYQTDGKVELQKVKAACLEAVDGGRYHIVLEAKKAASSLVCGKHFYASVLRKNTDRPTPLIVLERWL
ncbi:hypothetical protein KSS87_023063, partial [Heliosperma pusillum]